MITTNQQALKLLTLLFHKDPIHSLKILDPSVDQHLLYESQMCILAEQQNVHTSKTDENVKENTEAHTSTQGTRTSGRKRE